MFESLFPPAVIFRKHCTTKQYLWVLFGGGIFSLSLTHPVQECRLGRKRCRCASGHCFSSLLPPDELQEIQTFFLTQNGEEADVINCIYLSKYFYLNEGNCSKILRCILVLLNGTFCSLKQLTTKYSRQKKHRFSLWKKSFVLGSKSSIQLAINLIQPKSGIKNVSKILTRKIFSSFCLGI